MASPVTVADLEARWRSLTSAEATVAQALLDDAWAVLLSRSPSLEARIADGSVSTGLVVAVVSAMVLRVMRNPDGKISETIDDYSWRRADGVASGALYVSDDELALLSPSGGPGGAFTITPYGAPGRDGYWASSTTWVPYS